MSEKKNSKQINQGEKDRGEFNFHKRQIHVKLGRSLQDLFSTLLVVVSVNWSI